MIGAVTAYVIFLQALGGAIAGSNHPARMTTGLDIPFVLCTSDGMKPSDAAPRTPEKPDSPAGNCCGWACASMPAALDQPLRGFVAAWGARPFRIAIFAIDEPALSTEPRVARSNPARGPPPLQV
ncbi:MAG: hypothetical protein LDL25_02575 [Hyphomicrobiales bacterium]|nr:hypothetical protein [Hyphomicrobiales bacterium]MCA1998650.1 hypothetical protein [Hyphomicrobiales bacterium]